MSNLRLGAFLAASALLVACEPPQNSDPAKRLLRSGPALTETALAGMYMSRAGDSAEGKAFVACLDKFVLRFDDDSQVTTIFTEISAETETPLNRVHIGYFTDQNQAERFKRLVDQMSKIDEKTETDIFNFDSSSTCVLEPEDCTLSDNDAKTVRIYWQTIEHGSLDCYE